ncbi:MAG: hypothetical protein PHD56_03235 [Anaerostipes sp.]|nr:hypothetical protein [Anaerostipes sp.]
MKIRKVLSGISFIMVAVLFSSTAIFAKESTLQQDIKKAVRATEPDVYNMKEIGANLVKNDEEMAMHILCGGIHLYNSNYAKKIPDGRVKITAKGAGVLYIALISEDEKLTVYDSKNQKIGNLNEEEELMKSGVKAGDIFYVQLPKKIQRIYLAASVFEDHQMKLSNGKTLIQTGTGQKEYRTFTVPKRSSISFEVETDKKGEKSYGRIQKYEHGTWKYVTKTFVMTDSTGGYAALEKGSYRFVLTVSKDTIYELNYQRKTCVKKYAVKKSKAQNISKGDERRNVYLASEKASRWYKIKKTNTKKDDVIYLSGEMNSGKLKVQIYKKGKKKPVKTVKLSGGYNDFGYYVLPKARGTYYIKVTKLGKAMNGSYEVSYDSEE